MGIFGQALLGLCESARCTDSACCRTTVGGKLNEVLTTRWKKTKYAISLLKLVVVQRKSEGRQKRLAPCSTYVHRVARTIDVRILEHESHRQTKMMMRNGILTAQNMEILGETSVRLLEQLRPS
jgi:hypothetical protein